MSPIATVFYNKEVFKELIDVKLDGNSMLHSVYFASIDGGKDYSESDLTTSSDYRKNLTKDIYIKATGSSTKLKEGIAPWIAQYGQKLISLENVDKFSQFKTEITNFKSSISTTTTTTTSPTSPSEADIDLYVKIMSTPLTPELKKA